MNCGHSPNNTYKNRQTGTTTNNVRSNGSDCNNSDGWPPPAGAVNSSCYCREHTPLIFKYILLLELWLLRFDGRYKLTMIMWQHVILVLICLLIAAIPEQCGGTGATSQDAANDQIYGKNKRNLLFQHSYFNCFDGFDVCVCCVRVLSVRGLLGNCILHSALCPSPCCVSKSNAKPMLAFHLLLPRNARFPEALAVSISLFLWQKLWHPLHGCMAAGAMK